ncbi:MAG TPA: uroporphyrinogen-III synthase [Gammaproteobacteria bacterium]|nr:uroporphyrinogen-III synthase [Gammaproteobacteria bacterium]
MLTRQHSNTESLQQQIQTLGARTVSFPLFAVESLMNVTMVNDIKNKLPACALAICVSRNAAEVLLPHLDHTNVCWAAVGPGTAQYLQQQGIADVLYPEKPPYNSQALLQRLLACNITLKNQYIMIFTGEDGDGWLPTTLIKHGAKVDVVALYKRIRPKLQPGQVTKMFNCDPKVDIIIVTCVTSLVNLIELAETAELDIRTLPLLVISKRIDKCARELGFTTVYVASSIADADIISELKNHIQHKEQAIGT